MDYAVGALLIASTMAFLFGLGQVVASDGSSNIIATVSAAVVLLCMTWLWGYFCGMPDAEEKEEESE